MVELNGKTYETETFNGQDIDTYYFKGLLVDEKPKGAIVSEYFVTDSGERIGVVQQHRNAILLILVMMCVVLIMLVYLISALARSFYNNKKYESDIVPNSEAMTDAGISVDDRLTGKLVKTDLVVSYNQYVNYDGETIDIQYENIDKDCSIRVVGDSIASESVKVKPNEKVDTIPITITSDVDFPCRVNFIVTVDGEDYKCPLVVNKYDGINYRGGSGSGESSDSDSADSYGGTWSDPAGFKN